MEPKTERILCTESHVVPPVNTRLQELLKADEEGRVVVLPCKAENTIKDHTWHSCPFCGGDGGIGISPQDNTIYGCCWVCDARGMPIRCEGEATMEDYEEARAAWNRRADNG